MTVLYAPLYQPNHCFQRLLSVFDGVSFIFSARVTDPLASVHTRSFSLQTANEHCVDGKEVLSELGSVCALKVRLENHDFCSMDFADFGHEIVCEATKSVPMHDDNALDHSLTDSFQNGVKARSFEVDSGSNVEDDSEFWVVRRQGVDLALEIVTLVSAGYSGIDERLSSSVMDMGLSDSLL